MWDPFNWWTNPPAPTSPLVSPQPAAPTAYHDVRPECITRLSASQQADLSNFLSIYNSNINTYNLVGQQANIPGMLVAAIHYREASGDFFSYLENGDKLGSRTYTNGDSNNGNDLPLNTPNTIVFTNWNSSAVWALNQNTQGMAAAGLSYQETDINDMLSFCVYYNGTGYQEQGVPDPYILSGTSCYTSGKYTSDGTYDPDAIDSQLGILVMLRAIINQ